MKLNDRQIEHLQEVVNFILEFEKEDYVDWVERESVPQHHVYYHADRLADEIVEWNEEKRASSDVQDIERHRGLEIGEDGTVTGLK